nr:hypothetical protein [uncultured Flavobacterium sp.]
MKKIILAAFLLVSALSFTSCSSDDNSTEVVSSESKFKGTWAGTYTGGASGNWTATIDENGEFIGQASNPSNPTIFTMKGAVNDSGILDADFYVNNSVVGEFNGTLNASSGQGSWTNTILNLEGNWQGSKN